MTIATIRRYLKQKSHYESGHWGEENNIFTYNQAALYCLDMAKDALDTFKPYKAPHHKIRDASQLIHGFKNLMTAVGVTMIVVMLNTAMVVLFPYRAYQSGKFFQTLGRTLNDCIQNVAYLAALTLRAVTQILFSPLTLLRIFWRSYLSEGIEEQKFQDRASIKRLIAEADEILPNATTKPCSSSMRVIIDELTRKGISNEEKMQACWVGKKEIPNYWYSSTDSKFNKFPKCCDFFIPETEEGEVNRALTPIEVEQITEQLEWFRPSVPRL